MDHSQDRITWSRITWSPHHLIPSEIQNSAEKGVQMQMLRRANEVLVLKEAITRMESADGQQVKHKTSYMQPKTNLHIPINGGFLGRAAKKFPINSQLDTHSHVWSICNRHQEAQPLWFVFPPPFSPPWSFFAGCSEHAQNESSLGSPGRVGGHGFRIFFFKRAFRIQVVKSYAEQRKRGLWRWRWEDVGIHFFFWADVYI